MFIKTSIHIYLLAYCNESQMIWMTSCSVIAWVYSDSLWQKNTQRSVAQPVGKEHCTAINVTNVHFKRLLKT